MRPRAAVAIGGARRHAGRAGTDLLALIGVVVVATQLRGLFLSGWIAVRVDSGLGMRAAMGVLTDALIVDLTFLTIAAVVVFAASGRRRELGRAFDVACVAVIPLVVVELVSTTLVRALDVEVPAGVGWALAGVSYAWSGAVVAVAAMEQRSKRAPDAPADSVARRAGLGVVAVAALGTILQVAFVATHLDALRPMTVGDTAPALALPRIEAGGKPGAVISVEGLHGRPVVIDFWATWCKPCVQSMPALDRFSRAHPDVAVLSVNVDDAAAARAMFDDQHYAMTLLGDDGETSERYGVTTIPHLVWVDRDGVVRDVVRGGGADLAAEYASYAR
jgi:thiol-disulfide isomerase/thioredoxin